MVHDFDKINDRRGTNSYKWDSFKDPDIIPLWVADMDFKTAPCIIEALEKRVKHGIFGYTAVPEDFYKSTIDWFSRRHGLTIKKDEIIYTSGVVPAISAIIKALTSPGDKVIVQTPVYNCFFSSIKNNECEVFENPLIYKDNTFFMDFEDLETKACDPKAKILLLCNPHNPAGRVWTSEELRKLGDICIKNNIVIVSDEIHCEIVFPGFKYTPFASISNEFHEKSITCCSPSKAFNIAGLQIANIFAKDEKMRKAIDRAININEVCDVNPFGVIALIQAYEKGEGWLKDMIKYIHKNYLFLKNRIEKNLPSFHLTSLEGTYLAWLDCSCLQLSSSEIAEFLVDNHKVYVNSGEMYRDPTDRFIRINLATSRSILEEGINRLEEGLRILAKNKIK